MKTKSLSAVSLCSLLLIAGCGGADDPAVPSEETTSASSALESSSAAPASPKWSFSIGGTIQGLTGTGLVLETSAGDRIEVPPNATRFVFPRRYQIWSRYDVRISRQPIVDPVQKCKVYAGTGIVLGNVRSIQIECKYVVGSMLYERYYKDGSWATVQGIPMNPRDGTLSSAGIVDTNAGLEAELYSMAVDPDSKFAYVTSGRPYSLGSITAYSIDQSTGALTQVGATLPAGFGYKAVTVDTTGRFVYAAEDMGGRIFAYDINGQSGTLTPKVGSPYPGGINVLDIGVDPLGRALYTGNYGDVGYMAGVSFLKIRKGEPPYADGELQLMGDLFNPPYMNPTRCLVVDPKGRFVYTAGRYGALNGYSILGTGALEPLPGNSVDVSASSLAIDPAGRYLYTSGGAVYAIDGSSGALTAVAPSPTGAGGDVTIDPSGRFLYVDDGTLLLLYSIDAKTGLLTFVASYPLGGRPIMTFAHTLSSTPP